MSNVIDEKVVSMRFDNSHFEKNCKESMNTLKNLRNSIDTAGSAKGLDGLAESANKLNFNALNSAIETVNERFTNLGVIGTTALMNITNRAVDAGIQLAKSLSVDQISSGWDKFADKTTSVGTLVSQGFDMPLIEEQLKKLNWYTDETSYNYVDMVHTIDQFTAKGLGLEESTTAVMGIANWAALAGQNAQVASRAFIQLSQAYGNGNLQGDDYKSLKQMSMITKEFEEHAAKAAVKAGNLKDNLDGTYTLLYGTHKGTIMDLNDLFGDALAKEKWLDRETMMNVFTEYGGAIQTVYDAIERGDYDLASDALKDKTLELDDFQRKAFQAAQECRTFNDAVEATKDAVSTSWMNIFENIFGNYEEAKTLWTDLAEILYDIFVPKLTTINGILEVWHNNDLYGRDSFWKSAKSLYESTMSFIEIINNAWHEFFPEKEEYELIDRLNKFTYDFSEFVGKIQDSLEHTETLQLVLKAAFSILDIGARILKSFGNMIKTVIKNVSGLDFGLNTVINAISNAIIRFHDWFVENEKIERAFEILGGIISLVIEIISDLTRNTIKFAKEFKELKLVKQVSEWISGKFNKAVDKMTQLLGLSSDHTSSFIDILKELGSKIGLITEDTDSFTDALAQIEGKVDFTKPFEKLKKFLNDDVDLTEAQTSPGNKILFFFKRLKNGIVDFNATKDPTKFITSLEAGFGSFGRSLGTAWENLKGFLGNFDSNRFKNLTVAGSALLSFVSIHSAVTSFIEAMKSFSGVPRAFIKTLDALRGVLNAYQLQLKANVLLKLAGAVAIIATAMFALAWVPADRLTDAVSAVMGVLLVLTTFMTALAVISKNSSGIEISLMGGSILAIAVGLLTFVYTIKQVNDLIKDIGIGKAAGITAIMIFVGTLILSIITIMNYIFASSSSVKNAIAGAIGLLTFTLALKKLCQSIEIIAALDPENLKKALKNIIPIIAILVAISLAMKGIKLTSGAGLFLFVLSLAATIELLNIACGNGINISAIISNLSNLLVIFTILLSLAAVMRIAGRTNMAVGVNMLVISGAVYVLALSLDYLGSVSSNLDKGVKALSVVAAAVDSMIFVSKNLKDVKASSIFALTTLFAMMAASLVVLTFWFDDKMIGAATALAIVFAGIGFAVKSLGVMGNITKHKVASWAIIMTTLAGVVAGIALICHEAKDWQSMIAAAASISIILGSMSAAFTMVRILDGRSVTKKKLNSILLVVGMLVPVAAAVGLMAVVMNHFQVDPNMVVKSAEALSIGLLAISFSTAMISEIKINPANILPLMGTFAAFGVALIAIAGALDILGLMFRNTPASRLLGMATALSEILIVLTAIIAVSSKIGPGLIQGAVVAAVSITLFMLLISAAFLGIGEAFRAIDTLGGPGSVESSLNLMVMLFTKIGEAIGGLVGGFIGGTVEGIISTLPAIANHLSDFMANLNKENGFIDIIQNKINGQKIYDNASLIASALLAFSKAELVDWIVNELQGEAYGDKFGARLIALANALKDFAWLTETIDTDHLLAISQSCANIATMLSEVPTEGGILGAIFGDKDLEGFAAGMKQFGEALVALEEGTKDLSGDSTKVDYALELGSKFVEFNKTLEDIGGWVGKIFGEKDMALFANQMSIYASTIGVVDKALIAAKLTEASEKNFTRAAAVGEKMSAFARTIPLSDGWLQDFIGSQDIGTFGANIATYAETLSAAIAVIKDNPITEEDVNGVKQYVNVGEAFGVLGKSVVDMYSTGWFKRFITDTEEETLRDFGHEIWMFCAKMSDATRELKGDNWDYKLITEACAAGLSMIKMAESITDDDMFKNFDSEIGLFCKNLADGMAFILDIDWTNIDDTIMSLRRFTSIFESFNQDDVDVMTTFANNIKGIGKQAISDFVAEFEVSDTMVKTGVDTLFGYVYAAFSDNDEELRNALRTILNVLNEVVWETETENMVKLAMNHFKGYLKDNLGKYTLYESGRNVVDGFIAGIKSKYKEITDAGQYIADAVTTSVETTLDINSPSKVMAKLGEYTGIGFINGIRNVSSAASLAAEEMADGTVNTLSNSIDNICDIISSDMYLDPVITPTVDLSNVVDSADKVNSVFNTSKINAQNAADARDKGMRDAFNEMFGAYSNDIVSTLNLNADKGSVTELYVDGNRLASTISNHMDRQLSVMSRRGGRM